MIPFPLDHSASCNTFLLQHAFAETMILLSYQYTARHLIHYLMVVCLQVQLR
jgi:hypothetical protein